MYGFIDIPPRSVAAGAFYFLLDQLQLVLSMLLKISGNSNGHVGDNVNMSVRYEAVFTLLAVYSRGSTNAVMSGVVDVK